MSAANVLLGHSAGGSRLNLAIAYGRVQGDDDPPPKED